LKKTLIVSLLMLLSFSFSGCGTAQIKNVPSQSFDTSNNHMTNDDVFKAIKIAGITLGWVIKKVDDHTVEATLRLRSHVAVVIIKHDLKNYSITYKSSSNLKYDAEDKSIHSNYNGWITNLDNAIQVQLSAL